MRAGETWVGSGKLLAAFDLENEVREIAQFDAVLELEPEDLEHFRFRVQRRRTGRSDERIVPHAARGDHGVGEECLAAVQHEFDGAVSAFGQGPHRRAKPYRHAVPGSPVEQCLDRYARVDDPRAITRGVHRGLDQTAQAVGVHVCDRLGQIG